MLSVIVAYVSLILQVIAAGIAISLFKRTKFNISWILISTGFILMVVARTFVLFPTIYPEFGEDLLVAQRWLDFIISLVLVFGVFYIRKIFQFMRRVDEIRRETENRVLAAVIRTEEQERQRFAKELHDGLGPLLSVIKMLVSGYDDKNTPEVNERIKQNLKQAVDEATLNVRDISSTISPHILNNFGLREAVDSFVKKMRMAKGMNIEFTANIGEKRFAYNVEVIMYRVICELLSNTLKHAEADTIVIDLRLKDKILFLEYSDNGMGFDVNRNITKYGMGLDNMRNRLKSGEGDIRIESIPGGGMHAHAYIMV